ncbi:MAG TPA: NRDE family protein [Woeseiaceae bacterium]|nr:NRDE family protein [Woeseiaceae bacterium]
MCLLAFAVGQHEKLPLIVAGNRDEFHARPAQAAHWWPDRRDILGGRDLQAGGTWLAVHRNGRFAAVTNYRDAHREKAGLRSRGELVTGFLGADAGIVDYLATIDRDAYAGFNLLVADGRSAGYLSNRGAGMRELPPGIYGLSNATLDDPWTKVSRTKARLAALIEEDDVNETSLMRMLGDREKASADEVQTNSLSFSMAHALTAPFIVHPDYGTRCSTVVTIDDAGRVRFLERRFDPDGRPRGESKFAFVSGQNAD